MKNVDRIKLGNKELILIGTAHISKESAELAGKIIEQENPDVVGVELCRKRYETLTNKKKWQDTKITKIIKQGKTYLFLANLILSVFQKRMGANIKIIPGAEMMSAIKEGEKQEAEIALIDRDIQITLKRAWAKARFIEKAKLIFGVIEGLAIGDEIDEEMVEEMKRKDVMANMMEDLGKKMPCAKKVLIDERDSYIANKIISLKGNKIVAVVGAGHIEGIKKHLRKKQDIKLLEAVPQKSKLMKALNYLIPALVIIILLAGFIFHRSPDILFSMFFYWFLINGCFSALAILFLLPHPLTILSVFIAAPFTSLNPTIGAGIVGGYVEAKIREPKVKDFESLGEIKTLKGFFKNRISKILLIVAFANLGSSVATFVALPYLIKIVAG